MPAEAIAARGWQAVSRLDVGGTWHMTHALLPRLRTARGTILNVTLSPHHGLPGMAHSSAIGRRFSGQTVTLDGARDNWLGPWPPPALVGEQGEVPTEERRRP